MIIETLILLSYLTSAVVTLAALVRALALEGFQWWAYVGYSINSIILILYGLVTKQHNLVLNQLLLTITNVVGLIRWRGK